MRRLFNTWLVFLSAVFLVLAFLSWLLFTSQGARFVVDKAMQVIPASVQIDNINGKLAGGLEIEGITIRSQTLAVTTKRLYIRWNPFHLLGGWIGIREISVEELSINDLFPKVRNPYDLSWPHSRGLLSWVKARIKVLHVTNFSFKEAGDEKFRMQKLQAHITWYLGGVNVRSFLVKGPFGIAEGSIGASFTRPKLSVNFQIKPDHYYYGLDGYRLVLNLKSAPSPLQMRGAITFIGMSGKNEQVKLAGFAGFTKDKITLDEFEFKEMGRPGTVTGNALVDVSQQQRPYELNISMNDLNLTRDKELSTQVSGSISAKGDISGYKGSFSLNNIPKSWKDINLEGQFQGDTRGIKVSAMKGRALNGSLEGAFHAAWTKDLKITGTLEAKNLDPARINPDWPGNINADVFTELTFPGHGYPEGKIKANFLRSSVRKRPLTGNLDARWAKGYFSLIRGELHGNGFDVSAHGAIRDKLDFQAKIADLGGLIPQAKGRVSTLGWLRWNKDRWGGVAKAEGDAMRIYNIKVDSAILNIRINEKGDEVVRGAMQARNAMYGLLNLGSPTISAEGTFSSHNVLVSLVWPKSSGTIVANGGFKEGLWRGTLSKIVGTDARAGSFRMEKPVVLSLSSKRSSLTPLVLSGSTGELIEIAGDFGFDPTRGNFHIRWEKLNLARANQFLNEVMVEGQSSGSFEGQVFNKERLGLVGTGTGSFSVMRGPVTLRNVSSTTKLNCDEKGIKATWETRLTDGGKLEGQFVSSEPAYFKKPESGSLKITWSDLDVSFVKPWLPKTVDAKGRLSGGIQGKLLSDSRFELFGDTKITGSSFTWQNEGGTITSSAENTSLGFQWKDQRLKGNLDVRFPSHGKVNSTLSIPIPARFPLSIEKTGNVDIAATGGIREKGIVSSLFPGFIEESKGQFSFEFNRTGTWESPDVSGRMRLENAAAYLATTGTRIKEGTMDATFVQDRIELTSFVAKSGLGKVEGSGTIWLKKLGIDRFKVRMEGDRFQAIYLPELQVQVNPDLTFEGDGNKVRIRGTVRVPDALARNSGSKASVRTSQDVVIVDAPQKEKKQLKTEIDIHATVVFGDKVRIQVEGLEGRMEGSVLLTGRNPDNILGKGTIRIVNGKYNSYGIKLDVTRGNIIFDGGPVDRAALDIMAIRIINPGTFDEIKAGVTVTGTLIAPLIKLYSEPPMSDTDVLSYMVLGRPIRAGAESNQTALLLKSGSAVLGSTGSTSIQDKIQQQLGIDTLDIQEGPKSAFTSSRTTTTNSATLDNSLMTVGKYLSPDLYVSYGRSLFNDQFLVSARYSLTKKLEIESKTGIATSVDLFYKIEFD